MVLEVHILKILKRLCLYYFFVFVFLFHAIVTLCSRFCWLSWFPRLGRLFFVLHTFSYLTFLFFKTHHHPVEHASYIYLSFFSPLTLFILLPPSFSSHRLPAQIPNLWSLSSLQYAQVQSFYQAGCSIIIMCFVMCCLCSW